MSAANSPPPLPICSSTYSCGRLMTETPEDDKRSGVDRRELDVGPPYGKEERREVPERRAPDVEEVEFDEYIEVLPVVTPRKGKQ